MFLHWSVSRSRPGVEEQAHARTLQHHPIRRVQKERNTLAYSWYALAEDERVHGNGTATRQRRPDLPTAHFGNAAEAATESRDWLAHLGASTRQNGVWTMVSE